MEAQAMNGGIVRLISPRKRGVRFDLDENFREVTVSAGHEASADGAGNNIMGLVSNDDAKESTIAPVVSIHSYDLAVIDDISDPFSEENETLTWLSKVNNVPMATGDPKPVIRLEKWIPAEGRENSIEKWSPPAEEEGSENSIIDDDGSIGSSTYTSTSCAQDSDSTASLGSFFETEESDLGMVMCETFVPPVLKLLDKSCDWLEENNDLIRGFNPKPPVFHGMEKRKTKESGLDIEHGIYGSCFPSDVVELLDDSRAWLEEKNDLLYAFSPEPSLLHETGKCPPNISCDQKKADFHSKSIKQAKTMFKRDRRPRCKAPVRVDTGTTITSPRRSSLQKIGGLSAMQPTPKEDKRVTPKDSSTRATKTDGTPLIEEDCPIVHEIEIKQAVKGERSPWPENVVAKSEVTQSNLTAGHEEVLHNVEKDQQAPQPQEAQDSKSENQQDQTEQTSHQDEPQDRQSLDVIDLTAYDVVPSPKRGQDPPGQNERTKEPLRDITLSPQTEVRSMNKLQ